MTLYRVSTDKLEAVSRTTFAAESLLERKDLQRLLRRDISSLGDDLMVIAEEYGDWEDSSRRIDLLCLSKSAGLVVVEIKRTEGGGHMDLQAIRYAAMVSSMTLEQLFVAYARAHGIDHDAGRTAVQEFLELGPDEEAELTGEVRIILVSADFSTELTTAVLWLNQHEIDITCIRLRPYRLGSDVLIDATQIIPLPEAADYAVKMREQEREQRKVLGNRQQTFRKFWGQLIDRSKPRTQLLANRSTTPDNWLSAGIGRTGVSLNCVLTQTDAKVECYIKLAGGEEKTMTAFQELLARRDEIEEVFGEPLDWQDLPGRQGCRVCREYPGGWKLPESEWPEIQERLISGLIRLESALKRPIQDLSV